MQARTCHTHGMKTYRIMPRHRRYWLQSVAEDGTRTHLETFLTEQAALRRLKILQEGIEAALRERALQNGRG